MTAANVINLAEYAKRNSVVAVPVESVHQVSVSVSYNPENSEDVFFVPGSDNRPAHLSHVWPAARREALEVATPVGDAALDGIFRLLKSRQKPASIGARPMAVKWREQAK